MINSLSFVETDRQTDRHVGGCCWRQYAACASWDAK